ncbi:DeoR/GlpR family transcriptional regulator of sugar metabolism [Geomicrobium halophilum]|uniref:DeoR/GlpR family transcriptional regulator of sugar metabolism n=1 Tax=Geomicrobium halophilum TaxID=549000 RepID=A0A841Q0Q6_9BACL|nr:DeoR/GlpR family DNA-binding transcription regulator [Geomicrobium halophilum]MBB6451393.1 DeoR/GlpR family transcriptional regulator of sugar metabolism [Geomicrobium halophilum]
MSKLFVTERRRKIMEFLNKNHRVTVNQLAEDISVSKVTLRSDLKEMEANGLLRRTHGGALLPEQEHFEDVKFSTREQKNRDEKTKIANQAMNWIDTDGLCICLDASSTCLELAKLLKSSDLRLTVVTSGIYTAMELSDNPNLTVVLLGGVVRHESSSLEGLLGSHILEQINIDMMFTSASGFTTGTGLTDFNIYEVELKKRMVAKSTKVIALIDHTKIGKHSIASFASIQDLTAVITDGTLYADIKMLLQENDVEVDDILTEISIN